MALRARKVLGAFEKRAPGSVALTPKQSSCSFHSQETIHVVDLS